MTKDKLAEGERRKRVNPFLLQTIYWIYFANYKFWFQARQNKGKGSPLFYYVYYPGYHLQITIFYLRQGKSKGKGSPFSPPHNIFLFSEGRAEGKDDGRDMWSVMILKIKKLSLIRILFVNLLCQTTKWRVESVFLMIFFAKHANLIFCMLPDQMPQCTVGLIQSIKNG